MFGISEFAVTLEVVQSASLNSGDMETEAEEHEAACPGHRAAPHSSRVLSAWPRVPCTHFENEA